MATCGLLKVVSLGANDGGGGPATRGAYPAPAGRVEKRPCNMRVPESVSDLAKEMLLGLLESQYRLLPLAWLTKLCLITYYFALFLHYYHIIIYKRKGYGRGL